MYPIYGNINIKTRLIAGISYEQDNQQPSLAFDCGVNAKKAQRLWKVQYKRKTCMNKRVQQASNESERPSNL